VTSLYLHTCIKDGDHAMAVFEASSVDDSSGQQAFRQSRPRPHGAVQVERTRMGGARKQSAGQAALDWTEP